MQTKAHQVHMRVLHACDTSGKWNMHYIAVGRSKLARIHTISRNSDNIMLAVTIFVPSLTIYGTRQNKVNVA